MRLFRIGTAALAGVLVVTPAAAAPESKPKPVNVFIEGDSLTVGAAGGLRQRLRPHVKKVKIDAQVGRFTSTGLSRVARASRAQHARVWVLALGTNDGPYPHQLRQHVLRSLRMAGPSRDVVWVTIKRPGGYRRVNTTLRAMDARYDNLHVVDWAKTVSRYPGLIGGDRVHGTTRGYQVRAKMIADATLAVVTARGA